MPVCKPQSVGSCRWRVGLKEPSDGNAATTQGCVVDDVRTISAEAKVWYCTGLVLLVVMPLLCALCALVPTCVAAQSLKAAYVGGGAVNKILPSMGFQDPDEYPLAVTPTGERSLREITRELGINSLVVAEEETKRLGSGSLALHSDPEERKKLVQSRKQAPEFALVPSEAPPGIGEQNEWPVEAGKSEQYSADDDADEGTVFELRKRFLVDQRVNHIPFEGERHHGILGTAASATREEELIPTTPCRTYVGGATRRENLNSQDKRNRAARGGNACNRSRHALHVTSTRREEEAASGIQAPLADSHRSGMSACGQLKKVTSTENESPPPSGVSHRDDQFADRQLLSAQACDLKRVQNTGGSAQSHGVQMATTILRAKENTAHRETAALTAEHGADFDLVKRDFLEHLQDEERLYNYVDALLRAGAAQKGPRMSFPAAPSGPRQDVSKAELTQLVAVENDLHQHPQRSLAEQLVRGLCRVITPCIKNVQNGVWELPAGNRTNALCGNYGPSIQWRRNMRGSLLPPLRRDALSVDARPLWDTPSQNQRQTRERLPIHSYKDQRSAAEFCATLTDRLRNTREVLTETPTSDLDGETARDLRSLVQETVQLVGQTKCPKKEVRCARLQPVSNGNKRRAVSGGGGATPGEQTDSAKQTHAVNDEENLETRTMSAKRAVSEATRECPRRTQKQQQQDSSIEHLEDLRKHSVTRAHPTPQKDASVHINSKIQDRVHERKRPRQQKEQLRNDTKCGSVEPQCSQQKNEGKPTFSRPLRGWQAVTSPREAYNSAMGYRRTIVEELVRALLRGLIQQRGTPCNRDQEEIKEKPFFSQGPDTKGEAQTPRQGQQERLQQVEQSRKEQQPALLAQEAERDGKLGQADMGINEQEYLDAAVKRPNSRFQHKTERSRQLKELRFTGRNRTAEPFAPQETFEDDKNKGIRSPGTLRARLRSVASGQGVPWDPEHKGMAEEQTLGFGPETRAPPQCMQRQHQGTYLQHMQQLQNEATAVRCSQGSGENNQATQVDMDTGVQVPPDVLLDALVPEAQVEKEKLRAQEGRDRGAEAGAELRRLLEQQNEHLSRVADIEKLRALRHETDGENHERAGTSSDQSLRLPLKAPLNEHGNVLQAMLDGKQGMRLSGLSTGQEVEPRYVPQQQRESLQAALQSEGGFDQDRFKGDLGMKNSIKMRPKWALREQETQNQKKVEHSGPQQGPQVGGQAYLAELMTMREELQAMRNKIIDAEDRWTRQRAEPETAPRARNEAALNEQRGLLQAAVEEAEETHMSGANEEGQLEVQKTHHRQRKRPQPLQQLQEFETLQQAQEAEKEDNPVADWKVGCGGQDYSDTALEEQEIQLRKEAESSKAENRLGTRQKAGAELRRVRQQESGHFKKVQELVQQLHALSEEPETTQDEEMGRLEESKLSKGLDQARAGQQVLEQAKLEAIGDTQTSGTGSQMHEELHQTRQQQQSNLQRLRQGQNGLRQTESKQKKNRFEGRWESESTVQESLEAAADTQQGLIHKEPDIFEGRGKAAALRESKAGFRWLQQPQSGYIRRVEELGKEHREMAGAIDGEETDGENDEKRIQNDVNGDVEKPFHSRLEKALRGQEQLRHTELKSVGETPMSGETIPTEANLDHVHKQQEQCLQCVKQLQKELPDERKAGRKKENDASWRLQQVERRMHDPQVQDQQAQVHKEHERVQATGAVAAAHETRAKPHQVQQQHGEHLALMTESRGTYSPQKELEETQRHTGPEQRLHAGLGALPKTLRPQTTLEASERKRSSSASMKTKAELQRMQHQQQEQLQRLRQLQDALGAVRRAQVSRENAKYRRHLDAEESLRKRLDAELAKQKVRFQRELESLRMQERKAGGEEAKKGLRKLQQQQNEYLTSLKEMSDELSAMREKLKEEEDEGIRRRGQLEKTLYARLEVALKEQESLLQAKLEGMKETNTFSVSAATTAELQRMHQQQQEHLQRVRRLQKELQAVKRAQSRRQKDRSRRHLEIETELKQRLETALEEQKSVLERDLGSLRTQESLASREKAKEELRSLQQQQNDHLIKMNELKEDLRALQEALKGEENEGIRRRAELEEALRERLQEALNEQGMLLQAELKAIKEAQLSAVSTETQAELQRMQQQHHEETQRIQQFQNELLAIRKAQDTKNRGISMRHMEVEKSVQDRLDAALREQKAHIQKELETLRAQEGIALGEAAKAELRRLQQQQTDLLLRVNDVREELRMLREEVRDEESELSRRRGELEQALQARLDATLEKQKLLLQAEVEKMKEIQMPSMSSETKAEFQKMQQTHQVYLQTVQQLQKELHTMRKVQEDEERNRSQLHVEIEKSVQERLNEALEEQRARFQSELESLSAQEGKVAGEKAKEELRLLQQQHTEHLSRVTEIKEELRALRKRVQREEGEEIRRRGELEQEIGERLDAMLNEQGKLLQAELKRIKETQVSGISTETKTELERMKKEHREDMQRVQQLQKELQAVRQAQEEEERNRSQLHVEIRKNVQERLNEALEEQRARFEEEIKHLSAQEGNAAGEKAKEELHLLQQQQREHLARVDELKEELRALQERAQGEEREGTRRRGKLEQAFEERLEAALEEQGELLQAELENLKETQISELNSETTAELERMQKEHQEDMRRVQQLQKELHAARLAQEKQEEDTLLRHMEAEKNIEERLDAALEEQRFHFQRELENLRVQEGAAQRAEAREYLRQLQQKRSEQLLELNKLKDEFWALRRKLDGNEDEGSQRRRELERALSERLDAALNEQGRLLHAELEGVRQMHLLGLSTERKAELERLVQQQQEYREQVQQLQQELHAAHQAQAKDEEGRLRRQLQIEKRLQERLDAALQEQKSHLQKELESLRTHAGATFVKEADEELRWFEQQQSAHLLKVDEMRGELLALRKQLEAEEDQEARRRAALEQALSARLERALKEQGLMLQAELERMRETHSLSVNTETKTTLQRMQQQDQEHLERVQQLQAELQAARQAQEREERDRYQRHMELEKRLHDRLDAALEEQKSRFQIDIESLKEQEEAAEGEEAQMELRKLQQQQEEHLAKLETMSEELQALREELTRDEDEEPRARGDYEQEALSKRPEEALIKQEQLLQAELEAMGTAHMPNASTETKAELEGMPQQQQEQLQLAQHLQRELQEARQAQQNQDVKRRQRRFEEENLQDRLDAALEEQTASFQDGVESLRKQEEVVEGQQAKAELRRMQQQQSEHLQRVTATREELGLLRKQLRDEEDEGSRRGEEVEQALHERLDAALDEQGKLWQGQLERMQETQALRLNIEAQAELPQMQHQQCEHLERVQQLQKELQAAREAEEMEEKDRSWRHHVLEKSIQEPQDAALEEQEALVQEEFDGVRAPEGRTGGRRETNKELHRLNQQHSRHYDRLNMMRDELEAPREELKYDEEDVTGHHMDSEQAFRARLQRELNEQERRESQIEPDGMRSTAKAETEMALQRMLQQQPGSMQRVRRLQEEVQPVLHGIIEEEEPKGSTWNTEVRDAVQERLHAAPEKQKAQPQKDLKSLGARAQTATEEKVKEELLRLQKHQHKRDEHVNKVVAELWSLRNGLEDQDEETTQRRGRVERALRTRLEAVLSEQGRLLQAELQKMKGMQMPDLTTETKAELQRMQHQHQEQLQRVQQLQKELRAVRQTQEEERKDQFRQQLQLETNVQERLDVALQEQEAHIENKRKSPEAPEKTSQVKATRPELHRLQQQQSEHFKTVKAMRDELRGLRETMKSEENEGIRRHKELEEALQARLEAELHEQGQMLHAKLVAIKERQLSGVSADTKAELRRMHQQQLEHLQDVQQLQEELHTMRKAREKEEKDRLRRHLEIEKSVEDRLDAALKEQKAHFHDKLESIRVQQGAASTAEAKEEFGRVVQQQIEHLNKVKTMREELRLLREQHAKEERERAQQVKMAERSLQKRLEAVLKQQQGHISKHTDNTNAQKSLAVGAEEKGGPPWQPQHGNEHSRQRSEQSEGLLSVHWDRMAEENRYASIPKEAGRPSQGREDGEINWKKEGLPRMDDTLTARPALSAQNSEDILGFDLQHVGPERAQQSLQQPFRVQPLHVIAAFPGTPHAPQHPTAWRPRPGVATYNGTTEVEVVPAYRRTNEGATGNHELYNQAHPPQRAWPGQVGGALDYTYLPTKPTAAQKAPEEGELPTTTRIRTARGTTRQPPKRKTGQLRRWLKRGVAAASVAATLGGLFYIYKRSRAVSPSNIVRLASRVFETVDRKFTTFKYQPQKKPSEAPRKDTSLVAKRQRPSSQARRHTCHAKANSH